MRVDSNGRVSKCCIEHNIGGLAANTRECLKLGPGLRYFACMKADQHLACFHDVFSLAVIEPDGFDMALQSLQAELQDFFGSIGDGVKPGGSFVYAYICCLGGQNDGNQ